MPRHYQENPRSARTVAVKVSRTGMSTWKPASSIASSSNCGNSPIWRGTKLKKKGDEMEWNDFDEPDEPDECAGIVMATLSERGREMLERFYDEGQTPSQICIKMGLTAGQFRAVKSRAWAHWRGLK